MKNIIMILLMAFIGATWADGTIAVTGVTAQQRYPWNGKVDVVVTIQGEVSEVANYECTFVATNCATQAAVPVVTICQIGSDVVSGDVCTRRYIWNATNDVSAVTIDDLALTVDVKELGGVQLWEKGPYWAECNIGATKPEEYGYYFWWGDTVGYKRNASDNGWVSVKDGSAYSFIDCPTYGMNNSTLQSQGYIDSTGNLVAAHDAATAHLGAPWRMPTASEIDGLINNCDTTWTTRNGVAGRLVTGRGGVRIQEHLSSRRRRRQRVLPLLRRLGRLLLVLCAAFGLLRLRVVPLLRFGQLRSVQQRPLPRAVCPSSSRICGRDYCCCRGGNDGAFAA